MWFKTLTLSYIVASWTAVNIKAIFPHPPMWDQLGCHKRRETSTKNAVITKNNTKIEKHKPTALASSKQDPDKANPNRESSKLQIPPSATSNIRKQQKMEQPQKAPPQKRTEIESEH